VGSRSEVLFIGGRSGVGKSSVASEIHARLSALKVWHCVVEGDNLDLAYPPPWEHNLAERNLADVWRNYRALGYRRMVYTNTVSVLNTEKLAAAMGDDPVVIAVLLTAGDATARRRLAAREIGSALEQHVERSDAAARLLDQTAPASVVRVSTDGRTVGEIAAGIVGLTGWTA
jgi:ABC-type ATPase involved in cell division